MSRASRIRKKTELSRYRRAFRMAAKSVKKTRETWPHHLPEKFWQNRLRVLASLNYQGRPFNRLLGEVQKYDA